MSIFRRTSSVALPANAAELLADWGRHEFDRRSHPQIRDDTSDLITIFEHHLEDKVRVQFIREVREVGLREGGWTVCGAQDLLVAFLEPVPQEILDEMGEARVRFLLSLDRQDLGLHLNTLDMMTLMRIDPGQYSRFFPG
jgi:hypothetical protein